MIWGVSGEEEQRDAAEFEPRVDLSMEWENARKMKDSGVLGGGARDGFAQFEPRVDLSME